MTDLKEGDRIELVRMLDDPYPIEPGTQGTVQSVTELYLGASVNQPKSPAKQFQIAVKWDNGRNLSLVAPPDQYRRL
jgi:hypothetical protein